MWAAIHLVVAIPAYARFVPAVGPGHAKPSAGESSRSTLRPSPVLLGLLAYVFAAGWFVATCMAAHLPRLLAAAGASAATAVFAGALIGPAQVTARLVEFGLMQRSHPVTSARVAVTLHPLGALAFAVLGAPAAAFAVLHGAGNGLITIAVGTLPLALFGPAGYGFRQGILGAPARITQASAALRLRADARSPRRAGALDHVGAAARRLRRAHVGRRGGASRARTAVVMKPSRAARTEASSSRRTGSGGRR